MTSLVQTVSLSTIIANDEAIFNSTCQLFDGEPEQLSMLFGNADLSDMAFESVLEHVEVYATGLKFIQDEADNIIGLGGLLFNVDVQLFELVCVVTSEHESKIYDVTDMLRHEAFEKMSLDKICARASSGSLIGLVLRENGFMYIDERAFASDASTYIWDYYELENDAYTTTVSDIFTNWYHMDN